MPAPVNVTGRIPRRGHERGARSSSAACVTLSGAGEPLGVAGAVMASPRCLRVRQRVSLADMARRLGVQVADVRALEAVPHGLWELRDLQRYLAALGRTLVVVAVDAAGKREALS